MKHAPLLALLLTLLLASPTLAEQLPHANHPPIIPIGLDAYRDWHKLPLQRIGIRAFMRSTYDRTGNNNRADASNYLYATANDFNVTLDVAGPGILYFVRTNHFHGSPWHYEVDGRDFVVTETATADPDNFRDKYTRTTFIPEDLFPHPLVWTWTTTKGADLMWVPIAFQDSFRLAYGRTYYGTGYYIYHLIPKGLEHISRPLRSWDQTPPSRDVLDFLNRAGTDIAPTTGDTRTRTGTLTTLPPFETVNLTTLHTGPATIRAFKLTIPREHAYDLGHARLKITWDDRWHPSIDAPLALFFGAGHLYNNDDREYLVEGLPLVIRYAGDSVHLDCYWPMPFFKNARIEIENRAGRPIENLQWEIREQPLTDPANHVTYFHATFADHPTPTLGQDLTFLDTSAVEGGGPWSGHFVGMSWIFTRTGELATLEGDPRFFFDDSKTPQAWGTGTEEWGGGGDYWGGQNMTIPLAGHPVGSPKDEAEHPLDLLHSAYRFLIADIFPFGRRAVINLEHGGVNSYNEHYSGVTYWYGIDSPTLILTDELNVSHPGDIEAHNYTSPSATAPVELISRYEWGPPTDDFDWFHPGASEEDRRFYGARMHYPAERDLVRSMTGTSQFTVNIEPDNHGLLLRRKFDYAHPNQRASVSIRESGNPNAPWTSVGQWYTAGSNAWMYSYPRGETDNAQHRFRESDRRWREDEFPIAGKHTRGLSRIDIRIQHVPNFQDLFPGQPFPTPSAWSESRYWIYSYIMPTVTLSKEVPQPDSLTPTDE